MLKKYLLVVGASVVAVSSLNAGLVEGTVTFVTPGAGIIFHEIESFYGPNSVVYTYSSNLWTGSTHGRNKRLRKFAAEHVKPGKKVYFVKKRDVEVLRLIEKCSKRSKNSDGVSRDCERVKNMSKKITEIDNNVFIVKVNNRWL